VSVTNVVPEPEPEPEPDPLLESIARGQTQYAQLCTVCHAGDGSGGIGPSLRTSGFNTFAALRAKIDGSMPQGNPTGCRDSGGSTCATDIANFVIDEFQ
jgi:mono/diheme cytochrome c family protein